MKIQWCVAFEKNSDELLTSLVHNNATRIDFFCFLHADVTIFIYNTLFEWEYNGIKDYLLISILHTSRFRWMLLKLEWGLRNGKLKMEIENATFF